MNSVRPMSGPRNFISVPPGGIRPRFTDTVVPRATGPSSSSVASVAGWPVITVNMFRSYWLPTGPTLPPKEPRYDDCGIHGAFGATGATQVGGDPGVAGAPGDGLSGFALPGTGGDGVSHEGSGGLGSVRLGVRLTSGGPTATRFPSGPITVPGGGARSLGG